MKKNKYRWREMKDEKPKQTEPIFFKRSHSIPVLSGYFCRILKDEAKIKIQTDFYGNEFKDIFHPIDDILWRKMCKLPGEE